MSWGRISKHPRVYARGKMHVEFVVNKWRTRDAENMNPPVPNVTLHDTLTDAKEHCDSIIDCRPCACTLCKGKAVRRG